MTGISLGSAMTAAEGRPAGFDYLRLGLALAIFATHCISATDRPKLYFADAPLVIGPVMALVPAFFALSGFLVAGSLVRNPSLTEFGVMRAARIFPALAVDTLFAAFLLGPVFTTLDTGAYFASPEVWRYLANMLGWISYTLPGVFTENPSPLVNSQLWTIRWELYVYAALYLAALLGVFNRPRLLLAMTVALDIAFSAYIAIEGMGRYVGMALVPSFVTGACAYQWRHAIRVHRPAIAAALIVIVLAWPVRPLTVVLPWATIYVTLAIGVFNPRRWAVVNSGDYSYGIYLYSVPIIQAWIAAVPFARSWYGSLLLATPTVLIFAALSWHLVEKRVLRQRPVIAGFLVSLVGRIATVRTHGRASAGDQDGA